MADFQSNRDTNRFFCLGLDVNRPVDAVKQLHFPLLKNVRTYQIGRIEPREGITLIGTIDSGAAIHSLRRLNNPRTGAYIRVVASVDSTLSTGTTGTFTQRDNGYSGNPLAMVPYRPAQSPDPWMYCMDSARQRKVDVSGNVHHVGLATPLAPPNVSRTRPYWKAAFTLPMDNTDWTNGPAFVATFPGTQVRINTTITKIVYDSGTTGWCCVHPADLLNISEGADILMNDGGANEEIIFVHQAFAGDANSTTISGIEFLDSTASAGLCSIVLATFLTAIRPGMMLENTTDGTAARVESIQTGPNEAFSIRLTTPTGSTWVASDTIYARPTFRAYTTLTHIATETLGNTSIKISITATTDPDLPFTGYMQSPKITPPLDFSKIATDLPAKLDDYISLSMGFDTVSNISGMRLMFGCFNTNTASIAFDESYYYADFTPADMIALSKGPGSAGNLPQFDRITIQGMFSPDLRHLSAEEQALLDEIARSEHYDDNLRPALRYNELIRDLNNGTIDQATFDQYFASLINKALGNVWKSIDLKMASFTPVGTPSWQNIYYVRMEITVNAPSEGNTLPGSVCYFGSIILHGGYGPDTGIGSDYRYRYRGRCSSTGVASNWSPAALDPVYARREKINVVAPSFYSQALEADRIDFQRRGGPIPDWRYVGGVANTSTPTTFEDIYPNDVVLTSPPDDQIKYQLWPIIGVPTSGVTTEVCGSVVRSSAGFSLSWAPGTVIEVNNIYYTILRVLTTSTLEIFEAAGVQGVVDWRVPEPIIVGQNLPCFWGPLAETFFACGDTTNPGRLYWTNPGSADTTQIRNFIDVTNPSEPLQNGVIYNGRSYLWSTERMFQVLPAQTDEAGVVIGWSVIDIPNSTGLFSRYAITGFQGQPGPKICFMGKDGIYETDGGTPVSITDEALRPLFANEGTVGTTTSGVRAPRLDSSLGALRLAKSHGLLYFDYRPII